MKILLTGAAGMLGRDLHATLEGRHTLIPFAKSDLDIGDFGQVCRAVDANQPDLVINCAAFTDVDGCEGERDLAFRVNALGARHVAVAAERAGAAVLHVSTDYVFDGKGSVPYLEFDPTGPATEYGHSKLAGEEAIRAHNPRHYIVRTAWLYGASGRNFVATIQRLAVERERLTVVDDQIGNPTWTVDLSGAIAQLIDTGSYGTYHATNEGECSWYEFACEILRLRGLKTPVAPVTSAEFPRPAPRPAFSALNNFGLAVLGIHMRPWQEAVAEFLALPG
ncbi:MAG: dTDP-4-dehydrorhamnose reductase [Nitrospirota bacterium]|nr:dTDP-4-dehydrorhamnose reductase [Nitrospirota bacterium]